MSVGTAIAEIRRALDGRRLIWVGIRGEDAEALLQLPEFSSSVALIAPVRSGRLAGAENLVLEDLTNVRPDLDRYDMDLDPSDEAVAVRRRLLKLVSGRCVVMTYRPSALVSALAFSMNDTMKLAGMFKERQSAFENKPWVERSLAEQGITGLGWRYVADEHKSHAKRLLAERGPLILRASRSSGGVGIVKVANDDDIETYWPAQSDAFVAVSPFLADALPVNLSGCVFTDGTVRLHPASVQLIGLANCTDRPLGYCGNDFGAIAQLGPDAMRRLDELGRRVGRWLREERYLGVFGIDALVRDGQVHFVEVNARFQGSSAMSAQLAGELGIPDLFLDHLAATLGVSPDGDGVTLQEWTGRAGARSQVVVHNLVGDHVSRNANALADGSEGDVRVAQVAHEGLRVEASGALAKLVFDRSVTRTGFAVDAATDDAVERVRRGYCELGPAERSAGSGEDLVEHGHPHPQA